MHTGSRRSVDLSMSTESFDKGQSIGKLNEHEVRIPVTCYKVDARETIPTEAREKTAGSVLYV